MEKLKELEATAPVLPWEIVHLLAEWHKVFSQIRILLSEFTETSQNWKSIWFLKMEVTHRFQYGLHITALIFYGKQWH